MQQPLISIALPVYNAGEYLSLAVNSIINQTYKNWELIIIDDGSTDGCCNKLSNLNDKRIRLLQDGLNRGLAPRLNQAIDMANGQYFARMDQDDIAFPSRLMKQWEFLSKNTNVDLLSTKALTFIDKLVFGQLPFRASHNEICSKPWMGIYMPHPTWMGKTEWFRKHRYHTPEIKFAEDQELLLRAYSSSTYASLPEPLLAYRLRAGISIKRNLTARTNLFKVQFVQFALRYEVLNLFLAFLFYLVKCINDFLIFFRLKKLRVFSDEITDFDPNLINKLHLIDGNVKQ